jgi:hypothetical protein
MGSRLDAPSIFSEAPHMNRYLRVVRLSAIAGFAAVSSGCATILGGGTTQPVTIQSTPAAASFTIQSSSGLQMGSGTTPSTVILPRRNEYQIQITMAGYQPQSTVLTKGINNWIWGNLLFGWVVGFIVDFASGSAYKLQPALVQVTLQPGERDVVAVVRLLDASGKLLDEQRLPMVPREQRTP